MTPATLAPVPTLVLSPRFTDDSIALWRAALAAGWRTHRLARLGDADSLASQLAGADELAFYGETVGADLVARALDLALLEPSHDWLPALPDVHRRRAVALRTLAEARALAGPIFVKPVDDKWFPARVYGAPAAEIDPQIGGDLAVLVAEPVRFGLEVRAFVRGREVTTVSAYVRDGQLARAGDGTWPLTKAEEAAARACLERVLADPDVALPPALVIDVGEIEGRGWAVVEANPAFASGLCGADPAAALQVLRACCVPVSKVSPDQARWIRPRLV